MEELAVSYHGDEVRGDPLRRQLQRWVDAGVMEPTAQEARLEVGAHPQGLRLDGLRVAVLGAAAETSPLPILASWGADVLALDLPRPDIWRRVLESPARPMSVWRIFPGDTMGALMTALLVHDLHRP